VAAECLPSGVGAARRTLRPGARRGAGRRPTDGVLRKPHRFVSRRDDRHPVHGVASLDADRPAGRAGRYAGIEARTAPGVDDGLPSFPRRAAAQGGCDVTGTLQKLLRPIMDRALMRGLRAPRIAHDPPIERRVGPGGRVGARRLRGARGQSLAAWTIAPGTPAPAAGRPAVLAMHGWGANASSLWPVVDPLLDAGFAVMLLDASCHGDSGDEAFTSLPRFADDIATGLEALRTDPGVDPGRVGLVGHSVGAAAALLHAARCARTGAPVAGCPVRAVVAASAFAHPEETMRRWMAAHRIPEGLLGPMILEHVQQVIGERFDGIAPINTIRALDCPVLLVHGRRDDTVPPSDALRLQRAHPAAELLLVDADHDLRPALAPLAGRIVDFLRGALDARPPAAGDQVTTAGCAASTRSSRERPSAA
jgi:pimeloyl-ACP methyl ester carboxylesterase